MRIAVIGGGPGGLYFSALAQQLAAHAAGESHEITVWERNAADDTFGFGVVFSDETLGGIEHADPEVFAQMQREFAVWDDIDVHFKGEVVTSGGHAFAAMSRRRLLEILQARCRELGVTIHFRTEAPDVRELAGTHDLVVAADGLNSAVRATYADTFAPTLEQRDCKYIWLGTDKVFDAFKFYIAQTPAGVMQIHGYPYSATGSTFIVEMTSAVWERAGFAAFADRTVPPGESDEQSIARIRELFADVLEGHEVHANNSRWISFTTVRNEHWVHAAPDRGTSSSSATPPTPPTSRSAPAPSWPWRTPSPWPRACTKSRTSARRWRRTRPSARPSCSPRSAPRRPAWSGSRTSTSTSTRTRCSSASTS